MSISLPDTTKHRQDACATWWVEAERLEKLCVELGSQVSRAGIERCELRVVRLWHFDVMLLAELHDDVEEVHRIEVKLLAEFDLWLDVGSVLIGRDFCDDIDDDLFYLIFCHFKNG